MRHLRCLKRVSLMMILLLSLPHLTGCASVRLHPIDKQDIARMAKGTSYTCDRDGYFLSDFYVQQVMEAKVERIKSR